MTKKEIADKLYDIASDLECVCGDLEISRDLHEQINGCFDRTEITDREAVYIYKKVSVFSFVQFDRLHTEHKQFSELITRLYALMQEISA